jgi:methyl-accepting chemotaxis protein
MVHFDSFSTGKKLGLLIGSAMLGILIMAAVCLISERQMIMRERQSNVSQNVEVAHGLIVYFHNEVSQGKMTDEEGRQRALQTIKGLRYNGSEYFWVNDLSPKMIMHPIKPDLDGNDLTNYKDPTGKSLFVEFVKTVKTSGSGFVFYMWPKPGSANPVQKVSFVKGFAPWGWIIGSGVYIDTVDATIAQRALSIVMGAVILAGILFAIGLLISRSLLNQLGGEPAYAAVITQHIADGDLGVDIRLEPHDTSSLLYAIKIMRDNFANIVARVHQGAESIAAASAQIAQGNNDLSARTESQASSLEETASSMEELSATVKQNADSARQANQLAMSASTVAIRGGEVVGQVVETMQDINDASRKISDIISVIDGIAFQTNILALNAAVEAARAGEQGRGFAVVASEVRSLAGRSAQAAKEIKSLINASVERVEKGTLQVGQAGTTMTEVVSSIRRVTDIMGEISAASHEQSMGVSQVGQAVTQMDQVTQQNAALVEEMAAAAGSLKSQAQELVQVVEVFRLSAHHR